LTKLKTVTSVADILERELEPTIKEWLRRVNLVPELFDIPLSDADRTGHLPKLYFDLISRLRLPRNAHPPVSVAAAAHGQMRRAQGYSAGMGSKRRRASATTSSRIISTTMPSSKAELPLRLGLQCAGDLFREPLVALKIRN
jgi:hypothetical protein